MLYKIFGIDAELLIDHAWGRETTTMKDIKAYKAKGSSMSSGQILPRDYHFEECKVVIKEMTDALCLDMAERGIVTESLSLMIGYSNELELPHSHGTVALNVCTNSYSIIIPHVIKLYERITERDQTIRRLALTCNRIYDKTYEQYDLFTDYNQIEKEHRLQKAALEIKKKFGKNSFLRGMDLQEVGTTMERNRQIGGHKSGE